MSNQSESAGIYVAYIGNDTLGMCGHMVSALSAIRFFPKSKPLIKQQNISIETKLIVKELAAYGRLFHLS